MTIQGFFKKVIRIYNERPKLSKKVLRAADNLPSNKKKILLISHELSYTGAPIVLLNIAKILKKHNFDVMVVSQFGGGLEKEFKKEEIPVFVLGVLYPRTELFVSLVKRFDLVFCNTVIVFRAVWYLHELVKFIWMVHEGEYFEKESLKWYSIEKRNCPSITEVFKVAEELYTVSEYSANIFAKYNDNIKLIYNGIEDKQNKYAPIKHNKLTFSHVGTVNHRKATDIFVEAVSLLPDSYLQKAEFFIVGEANDNFASDLKKKSGKNINWLGKFSDKDKLYEIYNRTDLLVCVSRDDPAPLVVTEAAMFEVPAVISKNVGSTFLIKDNESGFIVPTEDAAALADVMKKVIDNPKMLELMKKEVRKNYLLTSTMQNFENNFMQIVNTKLGIGNVDEQN